MKIYLDKKSCVNTLFVVVNISYVIRYPLFSGTMGAPWRLASRGFCSVFVNCSVHVLCRVREPFRYRFRFRSLQRTRVRAVSVTCTYTCTYTYTCTCPYRAVSVPVPVPVFCPCTLCKRGSAENALGMHLYTSLCTYICSLFVGAFGIKRQEQKQRRITERRIYHVTMRQLNIQVL